MKLSGTSMGIFCALWMTAAAFGYFEGKYLTIGNPDGGGGKAAPYFWARIDAAGYSDDGIYYGPSYVHDDKHNVNGYHELLSGEWAAAIYYAGINTNLTVDPNDAATRRQAMWLTKQFKYPDWGTECEFVFGGTCAARNDDDNTTPLQNTGKSVIENNEVEITIDYEVVDMNSISTGAPRSPMAYISDPNTGTVSYIPSDQYIFLQTYTIKNLKSTTLTDLEFYQFLHSHGANEYSSQVNSTYTDTSILDPLSSYTPIKSVHDVGNFRYDITQWNHRPFGNATHVDFVNFSSTVEPNWIDNSYYEGGHSYNTYKPSRGTHWHIEDRLLNDANSIYNAEVGGAMGWSLGSLDPNETASMTIAFMFAPEQDSPELILTKTIEDPNDCYSPGDEFTYTIEWQNSGQEDAENAILTDYLPAGLTYPITFSINPDWSVSSSDPNYGVNSLHTYTWDLGTIPAGTSGSVTLTVTVNEMAPPGVTVFNEVVLKTSIGTARGSHNTPICCWDNSGIIYVDESATGMNNGLDWTNAYNDLQDALNRADANCWNSTEIRVAAGVYDPGRIETTTFKIPDNTSMYGGYRGGTIDPGDRNPDQYVTILTGDRDLDRNKRIITMGNETTLDGFFVTGAAEYGVYGNGADFEVKNCKIENSKLDGVHAKDGDIEISWCKVSSNSRYGIYHSGESFVVTLMNSNISNNKRYGIYSSTSTPIVKNSVIDNNGFSEDGFEGVYIDKPYNTPVLYNNTILCNANEGISWVDDRTISDPNARDWPDIQNCIVYYNNNRDDQVAGFNPDAYADYCCIQDCNEIETNDNINDDPEFAYTIDPNKTPDPNNLVHLAWDSPCRDKGNPTHDANDVGVYDIDAEARITNSRVDIGADEIDACNDNDNDDIFNALDWDSDGQVNFEEFSAFQEAWLSHDPNDPIFDPNSASYNENASDPNHADYIDPNRMEDWYDWQYVCNLDATGDSQYEIDLADLQAFVSDTPWCWIACWTQSRMDRFDTMAAAMSSGGESMMMTMDAALMQSAEDVSLSLDPAEAFAQTVKLSETNAMDKSIVEILAVVEQELQLVKKKDSQSLIEIKNFLEDCLEEIRL